MLPFLPLFPWPGVALPVPYHAVAVEKDEPLCSEASLARRSFSLSRRRQTASSLDQSIAESTMLSLLASYSYRAAIAAHAKESSLAGLTNRRQRVEVKLVTNPRMRT